MTVTKLFARYLNVKTSDNTRQPSITGLLLAFYVGVLAYWMYTGYFRSDLTFVAGLGVLALSTVVRQPGTGSWRFAFWAALCIGLAWAIPARTFHFLALMFAAGFVFENVKGRINEAPILTTLLLTAVVKTMSIVLGFAIRLELSKNAAAALRFLGMNAVAEGNMIRYEEQYFSVDPACMGLQMVEVSFLFCFLLLGLLERRSGKYLSWPVLLSVVAGVGFLNLIFNQLRIIFLVLFRILPENPMHDVVGLAGLTLYVFVPTWLGIRWAFRRAKPTINLEKVQPGGSSDRLARSHTLAPLRLIVQLGLTAWIGWLVILEHAGSQWHVNDVTAIQPKGLPTGCTGEVLGDGVVKYAQDSLLIYVKPIRGFYSTEHTPLICWQGSGYHFGKVWEQKTGSGIFYAGTLEKEGSPPLYTAWWFDNGREQTISQTRWRWLDIRGAPGFCLVNVTADTPQMLERQLSKMVL